MSSGKDVQNLPDGWILRASKSVPGKKYYLNLETGKSSWKIPNMTSHRDSVKKRKIASNSVQSNELPKQSLKRKCTKDDDIICNKKSKQDSFAVSNRREFLFDSGCSARMYNNNAARLEEILPTNNKLKLFTESSTSLKVPASPDKKPVNNKTLARQELVKNSANLRLSKLRASLAVDVLKEESIRKLSNRQTKPQINTNGPQSTQTSVQPEVAKDETKSIKSTDSKCSPKRSTPNENSQSGGELPSQFLTANKIISCMKAQLPIEYSHKTKQNDTFSQIEQGICKQTSEYTTTKHPVTPPQFSEACKIVSAIKSKLSYNTSDGLATNSGLAKNRMDGLRRNLNEDVKTEDIPVCNVNHQYNQDLKQKEEAMEIDSFREVTSQIDITTKSNKEQIDGSLVIVIDTNMFINDLDFIKIVLNSYIKGYSEQPTLLVPWRVINELDGLKDRKDGVSKRAQQAMDYLYHALPNCDRVEGQTLRDANSHIYPCEIPDDEILNCCLQQKERDKSVIFLSADKNLCNKVAINGIKWFDTSQLTSLLEPITQSDSIDWYSNFVHARKTTYELLANILENEMRAKYDNLWNHVVFKTPPWTLTDVLQCLLKHWIAVFSQVFPKIEYLFKNLRKILTDIESKDPSTLSSVEVTSFKDVCLEISKKCQIIPEYMELAKNTVDRLMQKTVDRLITTERNSLPRNNDERIVIDMFEELWTVFSSYCAKLCSGLGIKHDIEDKLITEDSIEALTTKLPLFSDQINKLILSINGVLNMTSDSEHIEEIGQLENVFKNNLSFAHLDSSKINQDNLRIFISKCRNMLQEALVKFSQLIELIDLSKYKLHIT